MEVLIMPMPTPQQAAANWSRQMANSGEKLRQGVQAVTESPTAKAAAAIPRMLDGIQRAAASGKIERGLRRVSLEDWRKSMLEKGASRVAAGAQAAQGKMEAFMGEFLPYVQSTVNAVNSEMPRGDIEQNLQRAAAVARRLHDFRRRS